LLAARPFVSAARAIIDGMKCPRTESPLHAALQTYGRNAQGLSIETMLTTDDVLVALAGHARLAVPDYREHLAAWVVTQLRSLIAEIDDRVNRRIAQAVLASEPEFHGKNVTERLTHVRDHDRGFSDDQFKTRRRRVLSGLAIALDIAYRRKETPHIFIAGNYIDPSWSTVTAQLGRALARLPVSLLVMASRPALETGYAMAGMLRATNTYTAERLTVFRRTGSRRPAPIHQFLGNLTHLDATLSQARQQILHSAQLAILFGGGTGTAEEARMADEAGVPVVPLAFTGGTARQYWLAGRATNRYTEKVDTRAYHRLDNPAPEIALPAAVHLITRHLNIQPLAA
jgi:hypothetical protein